MIGRTISHYRILEKLGEGGMGVVYKARDERLDRLVALKFLSPSLTRDEGFKERFVHEAKAASSLDHPNICTVHEIDETGDGRLFICMACYEGETVGEKLARGAVTPEEAVDIVMQTARGLARAHAAGIVHRDIKPANLMVTADGVVKILDFGLAKKTEAAGMTRTGTTVGTVAYMSPEQIQGGAVDHRSDIWSLGVVMYEMLTGRRPFAGEYEAALLYSIVNEGPEPLETSTHPVPQVWATVVRRALEKAPEKRYADLDGLLNDLEGGVRDATGPQGGRTRRSGRRKAVLVAAIAAAAAMGYGLLAHYAGRREQVEWARKEAIPEIQRLSESWETELEAYELATEAEKVIPEDPTLRTLLEKCSGSVTIRTEPPGASIFYRPYKAAEDSWTYLGESPLEGVRVPHVFLMWKMEKPGCETVQVLSNSWSVDLQRGVEGPQTLTRQLDRKGEWPEGMVRIPGTGNLPDFFIDRYEVTNQSFKAFVDAGGYSRKEFWKHEFVRDGRGIPREEAMAAFRDATGRPGPATWEGGSCSEGKGDYPVSGVSWYEAAAYAGFAGKALPTVRHWGLAAGKALAFFQVMQYLFLSKSNFNGEGAAAVGSYSGLSEHGVYDMAGNVREWCWNESSQGRSIRGGAWNDASYLAQTVSQAPPFDRSPTNGFRCVVYIDPDSIPDAVFRSVAPLPQWDYAAETPVSDEVFSVYKDLFAYDKIPLDAVVESADTSSEGIRHERIVLQAAYGGERLPLHLFLPQDAEPPYQIVIYFPPGGAWQVPSSKDILKSVFFREKLPFIVKNGRAVAFPVYKGSFERLSKDAPSPWNAVGSLRYRDWLIQAVKDFRRSVDYLETRPDIDPGKIAYYGFSGGGLVGPIVAAVEDRLQVAIFDVGALWPSQRPRPEADQFNYVPRVRIPTLMLNGRYDIGIWWETTVKPMYDLLGTPAEHKVLKLYDSDHMVPRRELIRETLDWIDRYLGPVRGKGST